MLEWNVTTWDWLWWRGTLNLIIYDLLTELRWAVNEIETSAVRTAHIMRWSFRPVSALSFDFSLRFQFSWARWTLIFLSVSIPFCCSFFRSSHTHRVLDLTPLIFFPFLPRCFRRYVCYILRFPVCTLFYVLGYIWKCMRDAINRFSIGYSQFLFFCCLSVNNVPFHRYWVRIMHAHSRSFDVIKHTVHISEKIFFFFFHSNTNIKTVTKLRNESDEQKKVRKSFTLNANFSLSIVSTHRNRSDYLQ